jgi:hypothetical protein
MKRLLTAIALAAASITAPAFAAGVGLSITLGEPGFYGQIDVGNYGRPTVIYSRPVTITRSRYGAPGEPLYLRVPTAQSRNWKRYCSEYNACARPVYFVRDDWYNTVYAPRYREDHREGRRDEHDNRGDRHDNDDRNDRDDHDRGRGGR